MQGKLPQVPLTQINAVERPRCDKGCMQRTDQSMSNAEALRDMAAWWRHFAEVAGNPQIRRDRLEWAAYLEHLADEEPHEQDERHR